MTSTAMVFAMLPPALDNGADSEIKVPMAISIIVERLSSILLTLLIVPVSTDESIP